jgi:hypothetical protein
VALNWEQVLVHSMDPVTLAQWWADALGWVVVYSSADEFEIRPEPDRTPGLDFVRLDEAKKANSRLHLHFRPDDQDAEVARLVAHGARRVDIGQGDRPWVVLADPQGNEFCVLRPWPHDTGSERRGFDRDGERHLAGVAALPLIGHDPADSGLTVRILSGRCGPHAPTIRRRIAEGMRSRASFGLEAELPGAAHRLR